MDTPSALAAELAGDTVTAEVPLGGDDRLVLTPSRTLVYRADGLLRDEAVETIPHDAERITVTEGRRKATIAVHTATGDDEVTVPAQRLDDVLAPLLGGVLTAAGETADDEAVLAVYRFSELTLVVTESRVCKHVGAALWDAEYESYPFEAVTDLDAEEGSVATQLVLTVDGRPQRVKTPNDSAGAVRHTLERALFDYHDVDSLAALRARTADETDGNDDGAGDERDADEDDPTTDDGHDVGGAIEPLLDDGNDEDDGDDGADAGSSRETPQAPVTGHTDATVEDSAVDGRIKGGAGDDGATQADAILERLDRLEATVDRQAELIERQQETIETLVEELRQGR